MWEAFSDFCVKAVSASFVRLAGSFRNYNEVVETISQVKLGEGGSSGVTDRRWRVESCDHLSVLRTSIEKCLSWLEFFLFLMLGIVKSFWKLERANDSLKPNNRNQQTPSYRMFLGRNKRVVTRTRFEEALASVEELRF